MSFSMEPTTDALMTQLDQAEISALQIATRAAFDKLRRTQPFLNSALISLTISQYAPDEKGVALCYMHLEWRDGRETALEKSVKRITGVR